MAKIRKSTGNAVISITAPDYAEARNIGKELEISRNEYENTPRERYKAIYGEKDFPKNL